MSYPAEYNSFVEGPEPNVLLYIDNSNMFESTKKYSGHKKGFINQTPDYMCRIDVGKLMDKILNGRLTVVPAKLYGSGTPKTDTVWESIKLKNVEVKTKARSTCTGKEKEVDTQLVADAVYDIVKQKPFCGETPTVILCSGDRDLLPVAEKAIAEGYTVEFCGFEQTISQEIKKLERKNPSMVKTHYICRFFDEVSYTEMKFKRSEQRKYPPMERGIVASLNLPYHFDKMRFFNTLVEKSWEIFKLPIMGTYIHDFKRILLVSCVRETGGIGGESWFNFYNHIQPYMHILKEHFQPYCSEVISWREFISRHQHVQNVLDIEVDNQFKIFQSDEEDEYDANLDDMFESNSSSGVESEKEFNDDVLDHTNYITKTRKEERPEKIPCEFKFTCKYGINCRFGHSKEQREFFSVHPSINRQLYKCKPCHHRICKFSGKSYLCPFAHGDSEARCLACAGKQTEPHFTNDCAFNTKITDEEV